ncbi:aminotransferase class III-fold pyridoxal phosphate-dependent enzyme [Spirosoma sp. HMF4905]|uniref:Aminotransferase class III-fold pyridoxal phosphate-dependent enzyme n=1 Tax=Spirosoma arboris TaxID=2682092 RepID=A0A7K1SQS8_9BACT|nr:aspartate aminotransferase family protein [Spirosoma arboris]MVM36053.1 aminotransferase class III-fold pyridoxal phosphate-dependent enzyme [Spirosoma arboris]
MQTVTHRQLFFQHIAQTSDFPLGLEIERAEGIYLFRQGDHKPYMDLISGIGVSNVGHRHPHVLEAIQNQLDKYLHLMVYGEYIQTPQTQLAHALVQTLPAGLDNVYFTNSGTEAVEGAMKLAKRYTGRTEFISCLNAYHGSTQGSLSLSGDENFKQNYRPLLPDIRHIRHGKLDDIERITSRTAAVIIEVVAGEAGVRLADVAYFQALRQRCTDVGALLIFDEIQTGFGRTGTFWAFEAVSTIPDILLCAKGMGGGMPIGAFISSAAIMSVFKNNPILGHITTFGGHPVSCAASLATLQVIQEQKLHEQAEAKGQLFRQLLKHPAIREVRGKGLMLAVEFDSFEVLKPVIDRAIDKGVITDWFLFCNNSMRIAPPLIITEEQIREACAVILDAIKG